MSILKDLVLLAGLGLVCWGVFKLSVPAGLIAAGLLLVLLALILGKKTKK